MLTTLLLTFSTAFTIESSDIGINLQSPSQKSYRSSDIIWLLTYLYISYIQYEYFQQIDSYEQLTGPC